MKEFCLPLMPHHSLILSLDYIANNFFLNQQLEYPSKSILSDSVEERDLLDFKYIMHCQEALGKYEIKMCMLVVVRLPWGTS